MTMLLTVVVLNALRAIYTVAPEAAMAVAVTGAVGVSDVMNEAYYALVHDRPTPSQFSIH